MPLFKQTKDNRVKRITDLLKAAKGVNQENTYIWQQVDAVKNIIGANDDGDAAMSFNDTADVIIDFLGPINQIWEYDARHNVGVCLDAHKGQIDLLLSP